MLVCVCLFVFIFKRYQIEWRSNESGIKKKYQQKKKKKKKNGKAISIDRTIYIHAQVAITAARI